MDDQIIWTVIVLLGMGTFLIRFSFIGIFGDRDLPEWMLRHLRYVPVAVLPGLVAPLVIWPQATDGNLDLARIMAAAVALLMGAIFKSFLGAVIVGMGTLYLVQYLFI